MKEKLREIEELTLNRLEDVDDLVKLDELRVKVLGKKGELTAILRDMGKLSPEERPVVGQIANQVRRRIEEGIQTRKAYLRDEAKKPD